jgi:hypothetical protein
VGARLMNTVLGAWLFLSAFLWPHTPAQRMNAWVVGIAAVTAGLAGLGPSKFGRYVNAALGGWLVAAAVFLPHIRAATFWNHLLVGLALVLFASASSLADLTARRHADI